ncbi:MAG TPA: hypothetical protein VM901_12555 [Bdellovibrionota bacterium]|nr:hypothetical protein [Bdellovibrionota bacterium]
MNRLNRFFLALFFVLNLGLSIPPLYAQDHLSHDLLTRLSAISPEMVRDINTMFHIEISIRDKYGFAKPDLATIAQLKTEADQRLEQIRTRIQDAAYREWLRGYLNAFVKNEIKVPSHPLPIKNFSFLGSEDLTSQIPFEFVLDLTLGIDVFVEHKVNDSLYSSEHTIWHYQNRSSFPSSTVYMLREHLRVLDLGPHQTLYDLGAGHGRMILIAAILHPDSTMKGVELVEERCDSLRRSIDALGLNNLQVIHSDVRDVNFSDGDWFYLYYPFPNLNAEISAKLDRLATQKNIWVSENSGVLFHQCRALISKMTSATPWVLMQSQ